MNPTILERLRGFQIPPAAPIMPGHFVVARLQGIDFDGIFASSDFGFTQPYDVSFGKMMVRTASHLLGGDACGRFGFAEHLELSMLLDVGTVASSWSDATDLQSHLVGLASSRMSLLLNGEALFTCNLYSFPKSELTVAYFIWRQQEASLTALDRYCAHVLLREDRAPEVVASILEGLAPLEKEEILREHGIELVELPGWQRFGVAVFLSQKDSRVVVESSLPQDNAYGSYLMQHLG